MAADESRFTGRRPPPACGPMHQVPPGVVHKARLRGLVRPEREDLPSGLPLHFLFSTHAVSQGPSASIRRLPYGAWPLSGGVASAFGRAAWLGPSRFSPVSPVAGARVRGVLPVDDARFVQGRPVSRRRLAQPRPSSAPAGGAGGWRPHPWPAVRCRPPPRAGRPSAVRTPDCGLLSAPAGLTGAGVRIRCPAAGCRPLGSYGGALFRPTADRPGKARPLAASPARSATAPAPAGPLRPLSRRGRATAPCLRRHSPRPLRCGVVRPVPRCGAPQSLLRRHRCSPRLGGCYSPAPADRCNAPSRRWAPETLRALRPCTDQATTAPVTARTRHSPPAPAPGATAPARSGARRLPPPASGTPAPGTPAPGTSAPALQPRHYSARQPTPALQAPAPQRPAPQRPPAPPRPAYTPCV